MINSDVCSSDPMISSFKFLFLPCTGVAWRHLVYIQVSYPNSNRHGMETLALLPVFVPDRIKFI